jgi:hypothetical protein
MQPDNDALLDRILAVSLPKVRSHSVLRPHNQPDRRIALWNGKAVGVTI